MRKGLRSLSHFTPWDASRLVYPARASVATPVAERLPQEQLPSLLRSVFITLRSIGPEARAAVPHLLPYAGDAEASSALDKIDPNWKK
jgi:hypothetical protein